MILPLVCNHLKFSIYYGIIWPRNKTAETYKLRNDNDQRLLLAGQHLKLASKTTPEGLLLASPKNLTDIVITVITVSRHTELYNPRYLTQTVVKLIDLLSIDSSRLGFSYGLMVCNVDISPKSYKEAEKLSSLVHTTVKYKHQQEINLNKFEKEKQDYVYCLMKSLMYQPKYVLLMEDDAYPTSRMLLVLEYSIQNIFEGKVSEYNRPHKNIAYLKLYHPERLLGFISLEFYRLIELAGAILLLLTLVVFNRKFFYLARSWKSVAIVGIYIAFLALAIGRQNFIGVRSISKYFHTFAPAPSCCTPANLYPYSGAVAIINSFADKYSYQSYAKDMLLEEFLTESDYQAIYVEPNIFQHIGQYSSLRKGSILDPYVV